MLDRPERIPLADYERGHVGDVLFQARNRLDKKVDAVPVIDRSVVAYDEGV